LGTIDTGTLTASTFETFASFDAEDEPACCNKCLERGSGASFCYGFRFDVDAIGEECVLFLAGFTESDITVTGTKVVYMRATTAPTVTPTPMPTDMPTDAPTDAPTAPTDAPTNAPTSPTFSPTLPTSAPTQTCRDAGYNTIVGTIDTQTLAGSKFEAFDFFAIGDATACCEGCTNRGEGSGYCRGYR
jgi:hypothetical protein